MNKYKHLEKGFTLMELLVVISIIGVLSSVVLASLNTTRTRAKESKIISEVHQLRNAIELSWDGSKYSALIPTPQIIWGSNIWIVASNSFNDSQVSKLVGSILSQNSGIYGGGPAGDSTCNGVTRAIPQAAFDLSRPSNGLTIYIYPSCGPITKYAIYAQIPKNNFSLSPLANTAYAQPPMEDQSSIPSDYGGFYCVDSSGNSIHWEDGWMPGYEMVNGVASTLSEDDGECNKM